MWEVNSQSLWNQFLHPDRYGTGVKSNNLTSWLYNFNLNFILGEYFTETKECNPREAVICTLPEFVEPNEMHLSWMVEEYQTDFWFLLGKSIHLSEKKKAEMLSWQSRVYGVRTNKKKIKLLDLTGDWSSGHSCQNCPTLFTFHTFITE